MAEEDGCDWGGTVGISHVYPNRDVLKDCHARGGTCPWCPPGSATYVKNWEGELKFHVASINFTKLHVWQ